MLMPQMIDALNRHSVAAIQQLERHAAQINQLQPLLETMNAAATDFAPMAGGGFALRIAAPAYWQAHRDELDALLHDYDITDTIDGVGGWLCMHRNAPIWFKFTFSAPAQVVAA